MAETTASVKEFNKLCELICHENRIAIIYNERLITIADHSEKADTPYNAAVLKVAELLQQGFKAEEISLVSHNEYTNILLAQALTNTGISFINRCSINLCEISFCNKIIKLLIYLSTEADIKYSGDEMLFELLHFDFFKIPHIEIAKLTVEVAKHRYSANTTSLRKLINEKANQPPVDLFDTGLYEPLKKVSIALETILGEISLMPLNNSTTHIIKTLGIHQYIAESKDSKWLTLVLKGVIQFINTETSANPQLTLQQLVDLLEMALHNKLCLPLPLTQQDGILLTSVKDIKRLQLQEPLIEEGENITLPGNTLPKHEPFTKQLKRLLATPVNYNVQPYKSAIADTQVGLTNLESLTNHTEQVYGYSHWQRDNVIVKPEIEKSPDPFFDHVLNRFTMSASALNSYLDCPLQFYFCNIIRIPKGKSEATTFGSAVHYALQRLFEKMQLNNNRFGSLDDLLEDFKFFMQNNRACFSLEQFNRRITYGASVLSNYFNNYYQQWNKIVAVERRIRNVQLNNIPLNGVIDKLEFTGNMVNVVDYKTGDFDKSYRRLLGPGDDQPLGGSYWRQAVFYKILIDNNPQTRWVVKSTEFDFVEPTKNNTYQKATIVITPQDVATVTHQVTDVWNKIKQRNFYTGCGKPNCRWCNFVKSNNLAIALHSS